MNKCLILSLILSVAAGAMAAALPTDVYQVLHQFGDEKEDGTFPFSEPVMINRWLFGTSWKGGDNNLGTIYVIHTRSGKYKALHHFGGEKDGAYPQAGLYYFNLNLYGTAGQGGAHNAGTLFTIKRSGGEFTKLYDFGGQPGDGQNPIGTLTVTEGLLYGVTASGGKYNNGTIYRIKPDGSDCEVLHHFAGTPYDGNYPIQGLTRYGELLFGTTMHGGKHGMGIIFCMNSDGTKYKVLHHFSGSTLDGADPWCRLLLLRKKLYGTTMRGGQYGNGVLFSINMDGSGYANLHHFCKTIEQGTIASGDLETDGRYIYGTTQLGGKAPNGGILYSMDLFDESFTILHNFGTSANDGISPYSGPVLSLDTLYGSTFKGGAQNDGVIYAFELPYLESSNTSADAMCNDFDGDHKSDATVYDPQTGNWYIRATETMHASIRQFGWAAARPVPADYDGDGMIDLCVYWPDQARWYIQQSGTGLTATEYWAHRYTPDAVPVCGDYDGDGRADLALYDPDSGIWYIRRSSSGLPYSFQFGGLGAQPVPGDYDGNGKTDPAVYDPARDTWFIETGALTPRQVTLPADSDAQPVPGDYDGDGSTDCTVYVPRTGMWTTLGSGNQHIYAKNWGYPGTMPVPADYDGDGRYDIAVYHKTSGNWYIYKSGNHQGQTFNWGWSAATPP
jgi:uncharacterized repeat protein (TIGR03803 family)